MKTFRFLDFTIYQNSKLFYQSIIKVANNLQAKRKFSLSDQLRRCSLSVVLNIAEGSAKLSDKNFCRFLEISIGSLNETVACLDILFLEKELNQKEKIYFFSQAETLAKQIGAFIKLLRKKAHCQ